MDHWMEWVFLVPDKPIYYIIYCLGFESPCEFPLTKGDWVRNKIDFATLLINLGKIIGECSMFGINKSSVLSCWEIVNLMWLVVIWNDNRSASMSPKPPAAQSQQKEDIKLNRRTESGGSPNHSQQVTIFWCSHYITLNPYDIPITSHYINSHFLMWIQPPRRWPLHECLGQLGESQALWGHVYEGEL